MGLKTLLERCHGECAFPLLNGPEQLYCGEPVAPGRPYCPEHHAVMFHGPGRPVDERYLTRLAGARTTRPARTEREPAALDEALAAVMPRAHRKAT